LITCRFTFKQGSCGQNVFDISFLDLNFGNESSSEVTVQAVQSPRTPCHIEGERFSGMHVSMFGSRRHAIINSAFFKRPINRKKMSCSQHHQCDIILQPSNVADAMRCDAMRCDAIRSDPIRSERIRCEFAPTIGMIPKKHPTMII
jgi:hypothetical protein